MSPKRGPKAIRAENGKTTKLAHGTQDFNDVFKRQASFWRSKRGPKGDPKRDLDAKGS